MLSSISWHQYWTLIGYLLAGYYCFVLVFFYGRDIAALLLKKQKHSITPAPNPVTGSYIGAIREEHPEEAPTGQPDTTDADFAPDPSEDNHYGESEATEAFNDLDSLSERITRLLIACGSQVTRPLLVNKIRMELSAYTGKTNPRKFQHAFNLFLTEQCRQRCNVRLEPADIKTIWDSGPPPR